jgi:hypothetical protein
MLQFSTVFKNLTTYVFFQSPLLVVMVPETQEKPMLVVILQTVADCLKGIAIGAIHVLLFRFHMNFIMILPKFYWIKLVFFLIYWKNLDKVFFVFF